MLKKIVLTVLVVAVLVSALWAVARNGGTDNAAINGLPVTASFYPLYEFTRQVGGDKVTVTNMTPLGVEPHDFEPTAKDLATAKRAKVFVYNGGHFEPWTEKFHEDYKGVAIRGSEGITLLETHNEDPTHEEEHKDDHAAEAADPHYWLDPVLARQTISSIRDGLIAADPKNTSYYTANTKAYIEKLAKLDDNYKTGLKDCVQRTIVVSHQSMGYIAKRYDLRLESVAGLSPEQEPSAARLAELATIVRQQGLKYIFFERLVSPRLADTIAKETGAQTLVLDPIEGLTDASQQAGKDYLSIQHDNLNNLRLALSCR